MLIKMVSPGERIRYARKKQKLKQEDIAGALKVTRNSVSHWENDVHLPTTETLIALCKLLDISMDDFTSSDDIDTTTPRSGLPVAGEVRAGSWLEIDGDEKPTNSIPALPDPRFKRAKQYALLVVGNSMNKVAPAGQYVIVAEFPDIGKGAEDGDLVVVRRERDMTYEATLKRLKLGANGKWELWPESTDPKHQEQISLEDADKEITVKIIAKVVGIYVPV